MTMGNDVGADLPPDEPRDAPAGYANITRIDQGGFATVYRALDTRFDRTVALKILRADSLDERQLRRFNAECLATGRVSSHPNIVTVYDAGTTRDHRPWLAMEYCSGGSLAHRLARQGPLPVAEVISIGVRLCSALAAAHSAGILHRDVKPHNVLLTSYGEPALADFGIASVRTGDGTEGATAAYTVVHAAPELLEGRVGTAAADLYSLGSTLYTLLTGQAPFAKGASAGLAQMVTRILHNDVPVITRPGVPPELEHLLGRSMAARPQDRPASAAELGASLADIGRRLAVEQAALPLSRARGLLSRERFAGAPPVSPGRVLVTLGGSLGVLVAIFLTAGFASGFDPQRTLPSAPVSGAAQPAARYAPKELAVAPGTTTGELVVTWRKPSMPEVVATVIYQGAPARARAMVRYDKGSPQGDPQATLHDLPTGRRVCVSAAHLVSVDGRVSNVVSRPVCAAPR